MNEYCIAQMILIEKADVGELIFFRTHNHVIRLSGCNLSKKTVATIAAWVKSRIKDDFSLEHFQKYPKSHRDHHLKAKDIREIRYRYANAFYNAWCAEMCDGDERLSKRLCAWHVNKNWICNLNRIKDPLAKKKKLTETSSKNQQLNSSKDQTEKNDSTFKQVDGRIQEQPIGATEEVINLIEERATVQNEVVIEKEVTDQTKKIEEVEKPSKRQVGKKLLFGMRSALSFEMFNEKKPSLKSCLVPIMITKLSKNILIKHTLPDMNNGQMHIFRALAHAIQTCIWSLGILR